MTETPLIELRHIVFRYPGKDTPTLDRIMLSLRERQRLGLIGPNGCGKTTLFHCLMGLLKPEAGTVVFRGAELNQEKDFFELRRQTGMLFQDADDQLFSPTVIEDVAFGPLNLGYPPDQARQTALQTLADLGLEHLENRVTHHLSGGEKKLVSLATILSMHPQALFLDEPTNSLDPDTRVKLIDILNGLDLAYIIISHDYDFIAATCVDLAAMERGRIEPVDTALLHAHHHVHPHGAKPHDHGDRK